MARYYSPYANYTANVLKERIPRHPVTGDLMVDQKVNAVRAVFGDFGPEIDVPIPGTEYDAEGRPISTQKGTVIRGHYFDTEVAQQQNGWTDEEREAVERRLDWICENVPEQCQHVEDARLPVPWPTYDTIDSPGKIAALAAELGFEAEALAYERQNKNRPQVVQQLEKKLAEQADETALTAA